MRLLIVTAAIAAISLPAFAQQRQPQQQQQAAPQAQEAAPGMFACRTETETCFIAIVVGNNQVAVLYTNDPEAGGVEDKPVAVQGPGGKPLALREHSGRVVMITGQFSGGRLASAEVVDVASPLLSFAIKSMLAGEGEIYDEELVEEPPPAAPEQKGR